MSICREVAGFTFGHADIVRRAMAKKKADMLNAERDSFITGAVERNISEADAGKLFDELTSFANYAFNKSHATAYAIISYQTAYLKAHYPAEYMAALLTSVQDNLTKLSEYINECTKLGIKVLPPDINASGVYFTAKDGNIFSANYIDTVWSTELSNHKDVKFELVRENRRLFSCHRVARVYG